MAYAEVEVPVLYKQRDWQDIMQTCGKTIALKGCALTSATMVFQKWGVDKNPSQLNNDMGTSACPFAWSSAPGLAGDRKIAPLSESDYHLGWSYSDYLPPTEWGPIVRALEGGVLPIVEITRNDETCHWMVVYKIDGSTTDSANYWIADPATPGGSTLAYYINDPIKQARLTSYVVYRPVG